MSEPPPRNPANPVKPETSPGDAPAASTAAFSTVAAWVAVIAVLGFVAWWFGRSEPAFEGVKPGSEAKVLRDPAAPRPSAAVPASSDWAQALQRREMADVAARRAQQARHLLQRPRLGAAGSRPDWNAARLRPNLGPGKDGGTRP